MKAEQRCKYYHYLHIEDGAVIRIKSKSKPRKERPHYQGTFIINGEYSVEDKKFNNPSFPQLIPSRLFERFIYLGFTYAE